MNPMPWEKEVAADAPEMDVAVAEVPAPSAPGEVCVPLSAVAIADGDQQTEPEAGDQVSVTLEGKVVRVADGKVYFKADTANGEPMPAPMPSENEQLEAEGDAIRAAMN